MTYRSIVAHLLFSGVFLTTGSAVLAQEDSPVSEVVVVGSQIKGSNIAGILPVTSLDATDIEVTGALSGDELLQSIPQLGGVTFREDNFSGGVNDARGDVGSVNLRSVGDGNTLVLLNGRRLVNHPGTQAVNQTPVVSVNSNALPVTGIQRLEVLRDGAAAVYGTDAVAGVINTILDDNYEGFEAQYKYGGSEGTSLDEHSGTFKWGQNFNGDRSNFSLFGNFLARSGMHASEQRNSSTEDLRPFFEGTIYEGDTQLRNTSIDIPWGRFRTVSRDDIEGIGDDAFHIQPDTLPDCAPTLPNGSLGDGLCANAGNPGNDLRLDRSRYRDIAGDLERINMFGFFNHDMDNGMEFFAEASYYFADYGRSREPAQLISSQRNKVSVPSSAFYNPFGTDIEIVRFRPIDIGRRNIEVENDSFRLLGGFRGNLGDWDWESALLYSEATTEDSTNRVSLTLFREAIAREDASGYNVFAGAGLTDFSAPSTLNQGAQEAIDSFTVQVNRDSSTDLTLFDVKFSNPALFSMPAGDVGAAIGIEWRDEGYEDDRDPRLDGTITFTDPIIGDTLPSDVMGSSPTPDASGSRDVVSLFAELAIPLVSPDMDIGGVHSLDVQLAARAEDYSDVGSIVRPKIAASWHLVENFQIRAAYSEGFRAPNLEQINATEIRRVNTSREDWILCHAIDANFAEAEECDGVGVEGIRSGGSDLEPEESTNTSWGAVLQWDDFTLTADWWEIEQEKLVGLFSDQNEISLDYLLRLQGSSNPNVLRAAPEADVAAMFVAAGLAADGAGEIIGVRQNFTNLDLRQTEGFDLGLHYKVETDRRGDLKFSLNMAQIDTFYQTPSPQGTLLLNAVNAGEISSLVDVVGQENLLKQNGNPEWRYTASVKWRGQNWGGGAFYRYVGNVVDTSVSGTSADGVVYDHLAVPSFKTLNLYADYTFRGQRDVAGDTRLRFGVRNIKDAQPPVADEFARGRFVQIHPNRGRYFYASVKRKF